VATNETTGTPVYRLVDDTVLDLESGRLSVSLPRQYVTNNRTLARARPSLGPTVCRSRRWLQAAMRLAAQRTPCTATERVHSARARRSDCGTWTAASPRRC